MSKSNRVVRLSFELLNSDGSVAMSDVKTYNGMSDEQIATFEGELLEAFAEVHKQWAAGK